MSFPGSVLLSDGEVRTTTDDQRHPLGTRGYTRDGRVFHYAKAGATQLEVGLLAQAEAPATNWSDDLTLATAYAIGTTQLVVYASTGTTALTTDTYKEGYLFMNDETGEGQYVPIKKQGGRSSLTTLVTRSTVTFADDAFLPVAVTSGTQVGFVKNKYDDVIVCPTTLTSAPIGVTPTTVAATYYYWIQTWGPCAIKCRGTVTVGRPVYPDTTNAGSVAARSSDVGTIGSSFTSEFPLTWILPPVGNILEVGANGETGIIDLKISP